MANPSASSYNAADIEVLSGLDPVKRRPGMYTDTARPNHLAQEVDRQRVDEALAGHARTVEVTLYTDGSCEVSRQRPRHAGGHPPRREDPGRRADPDPAARGRQVQQQELHVLRRPARRGRERGQCAVDASEVHIKRDGNEYRMSFANGDRATKLEVVGTVGKKNTGTRLRFWPDPKYFDTPKFNLRALKHLLRAKAVLCPGLTVSCATRPPDERRDTWYLRGRAARLPAASSTQLKASARCLPPSCSSGQLKKDTEVGRLGGGLAAGRRAGAGKLREPDSDGPARHARQRPAHGADDALREFCDFRNLLPRGVKLAPEDVWDRVSFVLSLKMTGPAVQRPDQGAAVVAPGRGLRGGCRA
jgi:topoisomerase-4 subunit B